MLNRLISYAKTRKHEIVLRFDYNRKQWLVHYYPVKGAKDITDILIWSDNLRAGIEEMVNTITGGSHESK